MSSFGRPLKIKQFLKYLVPLYTKKKGLRCPDWPADLFAITAALLEKSGGYTLLGTDACPFLASNFTSHEHRRQALYDIGEQWKQSLTQQLKVQASLCEPGESRLPWTDPIKVPDAVLEWWDVLSRSKNLAVSEIRRDRPLLAALVNLLAVSDESLARVGMRIHDGSSSDPDEKLFWNYCGSLLHPNPEEGSSLCREIATTRLSVLPKSQTPGGGLSLRSLSHYLALCPPIDIPAYWYTDDFSPESVNDEYCNILLVPWPLKILPSQFAPFQLDRELSNPNARRFAFRHEENEAADKELVSTVEGLLKQAIKRVGSIHMVVLPELSVTTRQYDLLCGHLAKYEVVLIAGVLDEKPSQRKRGETEIKNLGAISVPRPDGLGYAKYEQQKHHRWKLDRDQIVRYGLTSQLNPTYDWWEGIEVDDRHINFMRPKPWLSLCVLLCEDLAQFDPVGRFVRAVAPDLVVALLMDGPQLEKRWPARYATVLADDPGSAVLTLTSLGMNDLSRLPSDVGKAVPRTIALWKDPVIGTMQIDLPIDMTAAIITARNNEDLTEWTADGRKNDSKLGTPTFGGVQFV